MRKMNGEEERILRRIPREILIASAVLAFPALFLFDALTALFILAGGIFSAASFLWLSRSLYKFLLFEKKKALKSGVTFYLIRLLLILTTFFIIINLFPKKIFAFAGGFSTVILVFLIEAAITLSRMKQWKN